MKWVLQPGETPLFGSARGCAQFEQRLLRFDGPSDPRTSTTDDEVLFALAGSGAATIAGEPAPLAPGTAAYVARGTTWQVDEAEELELLSVLVREPLPAGGATHAVVDLEARSAGDATAGRTFRVLADPESGCTSVTQFVGFIPPGRAPEHFHKYDEVVYVLEGEGVAHIDGESAPLLPGGCVHLPAGLVHCFENVGAGELRVLGVFRPAGSPAEAYYPDGTKAAY